MAEIEAGDIVTLKSGGPEMTVEWVDKEVEQVSCVWFDENRKPHRETYTPAALKK